VKPPIGFVLISHANPAQIRFLCEQLTARFDRPPIAIHHDFFQTPMHTGSFPANVSFVRNPVRTKWGGFDYVEGALRALRLLYANDDPDWFVLLSAADYPIKTCDSVLNDLYSGAYDAYVDHRLIEYSRSPIPREGFSAAAFNHPGWKTLAFERYMAIGFGFYKIGTYFNWQKKAVYLRSNALIRLFTPFDGSLQCYAGDHWYTANRKAAHTLLEDSETNRKLRAHFSRRPNPSEAYYQSVLLNTPGLKVSLDNKRFADWTDCFNHPRTLTAPDFPALLASADHFARKFEFNSEALLRLNQLVDQRASNTPSSKIFQSEIGKAG
jgi:hypothetical protein